MRVRVDWHDPSLASAVLQRQGLFAWSNELDRLHVEVNNDVRIFARSLLVLRFDKGLIPLSFEFTFDIAKADG